MVRLSHLLSSSDEAAESYGVGKQEVLVSSERNRCLSVLGAKYSLNQNQANRDKSRRTSAIIYGIVDVIELHRGFHRSRILAGLTFPLPCVKNAYPVSPFFDLIYNDWRLIHETLAYKVKRILFGHLATFYYLLACLQWRARGTSCDIPCHRRHKTA